MIQSIRENVTWWSIPLAAVVAGTVFLVCNAILTPIMLDVDSALVLRYTGALVLGTDALTESGVTVPIVGVVVHYVLSLLFTIVIAIVVHRWGLLVGIVGGAVLGLAIYGINMYTLTLFFEWFFAIHSPVLAISHVLFGAFAGGIYEVFDRYDEPLMGEA